MTRRKFFVVVGKVVKLVAKTLKNLFFKIVKDILS